MGFFSWECKVCGYSLLNPYSITKETGWMCEAVALLPTGEILVGEYNGYGEVAGGEIHNSGEPEVYHRHCWELVGKPLEYTWASKYAQDQGYFFDDKDYPTKKPTLKELREGTYQKDGRKPIWMPEGD